MLADTPNLPQLVVSSILTLLEALFNLDASQWVVVQGPRAVLGPGTGLGEAQLIWDDRFEGTHHSHLSYSCPSSACLRAAGNLTVLKPSAEHTEKSVLRLTGACSQMHSAHSAEVSQHSMS